MKTIINKQSGKVLFATDGEFIETETEIGVDEKLTENFLVPHFNQTTREFYEGAISEEIALHNAPVVPASVSRRQLRQALVLANIPLANIDYAISQIPDATEKTLMEIYWSDSTEFERNHPKLIDFSQALNISESIADQLFILAATL